MKIKTFLKLVIAFCVIGVVVTYLVPQKALADAIPADEASMINPDEEPVLMKKVETLNIYKLMAAGKCTGLVIEDADERRGHKVYQRLYDISCTQPDISSVSVQPLELPNLVAIDFFHNATMVGRITLNRGDIKDEITAHKHARH